MKKSISRNKNCSIQRGTEETGSKILNDFKTTKGTTDEMHFHFLNKCDFPVSKLTTSITKEQFPDPLKLSNVVSLYGC